MVSWKDTTGHEVRMIKVICDGGVHRPTTPAALLPSWIKDILLQKLKGPWTCHS